MKVWIGWADKVHIAISPVASFFKGGYNYFPVGCSSFGISEESHPVEFNYILCHWAIPNLYNAPAREIEL